MNEPAIAVTPRIEDLVRQGAWVVFSVSGGKDSGAALSATSSWLDAMNHPRNRRLALHADLGRAEWPDTIDTVRDVANHVGVPLEIVSQTRDLVWRFEDRWARSMARYRLLETISMVPPWSSSSLLFCRSEQKAVTLSKRKAALSGDLPVIGVIGIRRQESTRRAKAAIVGPDSEMIRRNGREGVLWNPIVDWSTEEVFEHHHRHAIPLHRAYSLGSSRLSCAFCTLASRNDISVSLHKGGNIDAYRSYVSLELRSAFSFQTGAWLADVAPDGEVDPRVLAEAKRIARERVSLQLAIPRRVLRAKSIVNIQPDEAEALATVRKAMGHLYGIGVEATTAADIMSLSRQRGG